MDVTEMIATKIMNMMMVMRENIPAMTNMKTHWGVVDTTWERYRSSRRWKKCGEREREGKVSRWRTIYSSVLATTDSDSSTSFVSTLSGSGTSGTAGASDSVVLS